VTTTSGANLPSVHLPRRLVAVLGLAAGAGLAACEKPTPLVTLYSEGRTVKTEAHAYERAGELKRFNRDVPVLRVRQGAQLGVDVDSDLADDGWIVTIDGRPVTDVQRDHYQPVIVPNLGEPGVARLTVERVPAGADLRRGFRSTGSWPFVLARR
jgi:hypothetical protein